MKKYIEVIRNNNNKYSNNKQITEKVARGYGLNYLIPNGLASIATKGKIKHLKMLRDCSSQQKNKINILSSKIRAELTQLKIVHFRKKCGKDYQIFGSVSENEIQRAILNLTGQKIEKRQILINSIKKLGTYTCQIIISEEVKTSMEIRLLPYYF